MAIRVGGRACIAGAGFAGLAAAAALSPRFDEVQVFEKDDIPDPADVRAGVSQGAHVHTLLRGGQAKLEKHLPGLSDAFRKAGAAEIELGEDFQMFDYGAWRTGRPIGQTMLLMSRPAYEEVLRRQVERLSNVVIHRNRKVDRLAMGDSDVLGVEAEGKVVDADLAIDARGRGGPLPRELAAAGYGETPESVIGIVMSYVSGRFKRPVKWRRRDVGILIRSMPPQPHYGMICPVENDEWIVSLGGRGDVMPPTDLEGWLEFARQLPAPEIYEALQGAELLSPLSRYKKPTANWRHYDRMGRFPRRLIPIGDTITSFNPTFGQGMTVAAYHADGLASSLDRHGVRGESMLGDYFATAMGASASAWYVAGAADLEYDIVTGERTDDFAASLAYSRAFRLAADDDEEIFRTFIKVAHMEVSSDVLREPQIAAKIMSKLGPLRA
jgi:2-polyprenyl-6-methoxyphenol hydroxylase-like FAD-dependent oxidoreductase